MRFTILSLILLFSFVLPQIIEARTTPEDIINAKKDSYNQKVKTYNSPNKQKLEDFWQKIADVNKKITDSWEESCLRQGEILDEFLRRNNFKSTPQIENARYWLTYAHEAVAFQAANVYVYDLSAEKNLTSDITSQINFLSQDLSVLKSKVSKSQNIIAQLVQ